MPIFSPTYAAVEGFRLTRERPWAVGAWAVLYLIVGFASAFLMIATVGPQFATLQAASLGDHPAMAASVIEKLGPYYALMAPLALIFQSIMVCAVYRAVLKPEALTRGYLKLGRDELRMVALNLILSLMAAIALLLLMFIDVFIAEGLRTLAPALAGVAPFPLIVGSLAWVIWITVRLSLTGPMTFITGQLHILAAWKLTRGHFWPLFGAYALAASLALIVALLSMMCFLAVAGAMTLSVGGALADVGRTFQPDATSIKVYFTPAMILYQVFAAILTAIIYAVILSPPAVAYAALSAE